MNDNTLDNPFWQYACGLYKKPGVADTLLKLQDEHQWNIPLALLMVWLGRQGIAVRQSDIQCFIAIIADLDAFVIQPLRNVRRYIQCSPVILPNVYDAIKSLEISIEQQLMTLLYQQACSIYSPTDATSCVAHNLKFLDLDGSNRQAPLIQALLTQI